jgi:HEAT repeat protein
VDEVQTREGKADKEEAAREMAVGQESVKALLAMGAAAAIPTVLDALLAKLNNRNSWVRVRAMEVLGEMGPVAATAEIVSALTEALRASESGVRVRAALTLAALHRALGPGALDLLCAALSECSVGDLPRLVEVLRQNSRAVATPALLHDLIVRALRRRDSSIWSQMITRPRMDALNALAAIGREAATPPVMAGLVFLSLHEEVPEIRSRALELLRSMAPAVVSAVAAPLLLLALNDEQWGVRARAAEAVGVLPWVATTNSVLAALRAMRTDDWYARSPVLVALGRWGTPRDRENAISDLTTALHDEDLFVRGRAMDALAAIGPTAATSPALDGLASLTRHPDSGLRSRAVEALGAMGPAACRPAVLDALCAALGDSDDYVQVCAVAALGAMGSAAATPAVLDRLVKVIGGISGYRSYHLQQRAISSLSNMGPAAARPAVINALTSSLRHQGWGVAKSAGEALERFLSSRSFLPRAPV